LDDRPCLLDTQYVYRPTRDTTTISLLKDIEGGSFWKYVLMMAVMKPAMQKSLLVSLTTSEGPRTVVGQARLCGID
jgi:hypothetical protein